MASDEVSNRLIEAAILAEHAASGADLSGWKALIEVRQSQGLPDFSGTLHEVNRYWASIAANLRTVAELVEQYLPLANLIVKEAEDQACPVGVGEDG